MAKCKGIKINGNRCRSTKVMANGYCFSHQDQIPNKNSNLTTSDIKIIGSILLFIIPILITILFGWFGATKEGQEKTHEYQSKMNGNLDEIKQLLRQRDVADDLYRDKFLSKYDLGYCLLASTNTNE